MPRLRMIMKLTYKLTLAFLFVSLIAIGLAALFVWATTATEFNKYVADQRQAQFVSIATDYYRTHGNWRGVDTALREQNLLPPFAPPGSPPPDPQPYALVDQNRDGHHSCRGISDRAEGAAGCADQRRRH